MSKGKKKIVKKAPAKKAPAKKTVMAKSAAKKTAAKKAAPKTSAPKNKTAAKAMPAKAMAAKPKAGKATANLTTKASSKLQASSNAKTAKTSATPAAKLNLTAFVTPLDDRVLVQPKVMESMTAGGLYIPDTVSQRGGNAEGWVVSVGRGHRNKKGHVRPMDVKVGDKVLFAEHSGTEIKVQNHDLVILREADVLGIIE